MANGFFKTTRGGGMFQAPDTQRQYEMANALRQRAFQSAEPERGFTAPGGYYVAPNNIGSLIEPIANAWMANRTQEEADATRKRRMSELSEALRGPQNQPPEMLRSPDYQPQSVTQRLAGLEDNPQAQNMAMALRMQEMQREPQSPSWQKVEINTPEGMQTGFVNTNAADPTSTFRGLGTPQQEQPEAPGRLIQNEQGEWVVNPAWVEAESRIAAAGKPETTIQNQLGGQELTPGQEAVDKAFAKDVYSPYVTQGGFSSTEKNLKQLKQAREALQSGANLTGPLIGNIPDWAQAFNNPEAISTREAVEEVVQQNLKDTLGAQFTEREGERLIARAYNPRLSEDENRQRLNRLIDQIASSHEAKRQAVEYFEENGTLRGFRGDLPSWDDFEGLFPEDEGNGEQSDSSLPQAAADDGITADEWKYMTPEERKLWQ